MTGLKLGTRFTLALLIVFIVGIVVSWLVLWGLLERRAEATITERSLVLMEAMNAVRHYTSTQINPLLSSDLAFSPDFIPETVPAYSAREVFEQFRADPRYRDFLYKEATLNPTNPRDLADDFEADLVAQLRADPTQAEISGFRTLNGVTVFYNARPLVVSDPSCLACHGVAADAPPSLLATYGPDGGFGWEVGEVIAAQMVYVPADDVFNSAHLSFTAAMGVLVVMFAVVILLINLLLRRDVLNPITQMAAVAEKLGTDHLTTADIERIAPIAGRGDELGQSASVFRDMLQNVVERERQLKREVRQLQIEVNHARKQQQVDEIVGSDFFQHLQSRASEMRERRDRRRRDDPS